MNQCKCGSYEINDDKDGVLCDKCLLKKEIEKLIAEKTKLLRALFIIDDAINESCSLSTIKTIIKTATEVCK